MKNKKKLVLERSSFPWNSLGIILAVIVIIVVGIVAFSWGNAKCNEKAIVGEAVKLQKITPPKPVEKLCKIGIELCDGKDNNCNTRIDENGICQSDTNCGSFGRSCAVNQACRIDQCLTKIGFPCANNGECVSNYCTQGTCKLKLDRMDCALALECESYSCDVNGRCGIKVWTGSACIRDENCRSNYCKNRVCSEKGIGESCTSEPQCANIGDDTICFEGFCKKPNGNGCLGTRSPDWGDLDCASGLCGTIEVFNPNTGEVGYVYRCVERNSKETGDVCEKNEECASGICDHSQRFEGNVIRCS